MTSPQPAPLSERFGIPGEIHFSTLEGLDVVEISSPLGSGRLLLQGALLLDWTPRGQPPIIWVSPKAKFIPGKAPRGGAPVCWPWFGPHESEPGFPAHGFARAARWDMIAASQKTDESVLFVFQLNQNGSSEAYWPHETPLEIRYTLGTTIEIELLTRNAGSQPVRLTEALHTYFAVSDIREISITGLEDTPYIDKVAQGAPKIQCDAVRFFGETDRVYTGTTETCVIHDTGYQRRIRIEKQGSGSTIVWNPWVEKAASLGDYAEDGYLRMVCVESGNALNDSILLEPGAEHRLRVRYSQEPLS